MLDLNYKPEVVVDISTLSRLEWLKLRQQGIGGSDCAAVFDKSHFKSKLDLFFEKTAGQVEQEEANNWVTLQYGNLLEDLVAQIFQKKTGFPVVNDTLMYRHPLFPFIQINLDRRTEITVEHNRPAILELKTASPFGRELWDPVKGLVPIPYEYQVRLYMAVMNYNVAFVCCLFGNSEKDYVCVRIERDLKKEEDMLLGLQAFWTEHILKKVMPVNVLGKLSVKALAKYSAAANASAMKKLFNQGDELLQTSIEEYFDLQKQASELRAKLAVIDDKLALTSIPVIQQMGSSCEARLPARNGQQLYEISYGSRKTTSVDRDKLLTLYPEAYAACVNTTEGARTFAVKVKDNISLKGKKFI